jgi:predicted RNase H-like HicB family nuclease
VNIRVVYQFEGNAWHLSSPDIQRWVGGAKTLVEARKLAIEGVEFCLQSKDFIIEEIFDPSASHLIG